MAEWHVQLDQFEEIGDGVEHIETSGLAVLTSSSTAVLPAVERAYN